MTGDSYKIIISLSHRLISFDYWQKEGADRLMPMPQGVWPAPLAFYSNGNEVIVGQGALSAANNGISGAFDSYFELLPRDLKYNLGGHQRDFRFLLTDAAEPLFADFFTNVLLNSYGRLDDNRGYMPITVVCESDIKPQERAAVTKLFKSAGYHGVKVVEYDRFIDRYVKSVLARKYDSDKVLVAWSEGKDLTFTLYDAKDSVAPKSATYEDLGIDPRKEYVEKHIWESVVSQNPWMNRDNERSAIEKAASDFLASTAPIVKSHVILSDGQRYHYSLTRNSISYLPGDRRADMKEKLDRFMRDNGSDKSRTLLILRGVAANNDYFEQNLRGGFGFTIKSDRELRERVMRQIIDLKDQEKKKFHKTPTDQKNDDVITSDIPLPGEETHIKPPTNDPPPPPGPPPQPPKELKALMMEWRSINACAKGDMRQGFFDKALKDVKLFRAKCLETKGAVKILKEVDALIANIEAKKAEQKTKSEEKVNLKALEREWREVKASAKSEFKKGSASRASRKITDFQNKIKNLPGLESLYVQVETELENILSSKPASESTKSGNGKPVPGPTPTEQKTQTPQPKQMPTKDKGAVLIAGGNFKDAREWYRANGDKEKVSQLQTLIRSQRGVDPRIAEVSKYKGGGNMEQVKRIITELEEFIKQCNKVGYDAAKYKKALAEYKRIK